MKPRKLFLTLAIALLISGLGMTSTASATTTTYGATLTGYTYMAGSGSKMSTSDGYNPLQKDYAIAGPLEYYYAGTDYWGYSWIKFDEVGTETVESAYLSIDVLGVGSMDLQDLSEAYPASMDIYNPGDIDVEDLWASSTDTDALSTASALRTTLKNTMLSSDPLVSVDNMTSNGTYTIDITDLYNAWVTGEQDNNGLVLSSYADNGTGETGSVGAQFASFGNENGNAPTITTTSAVPVPAAMWLLGSGLVGLIGLRRRNR